MQWQTIGAGLRGVEARGLTIFDGRLVAVGNLSGSGSRDFQHVAMWDGREWAGLAYGDAGDLYHAAAHDDALYVAQRGSLRKWDRQHWTKVEPAGSFFRFQTTSNTSLTPFAGDLVLCGSGLAAGPFVPSGLSVARLLDGNLRSLARGPRVANLQAISCGAIHQGKLFAAGPFSAIAGFRLTGIGAWDGVTWESADADLVGASWPLGLEAFSGGLLAVGDISGVIDPATGATVATKGIARWDGVRWHPFDAGLSAAPKSLAVDGDTPVVAVDVQGASPVRTAIMRWSGDQWTSIGELPGQAFDTSIAAQNGVIVVAGSRRDASLLQTANYVAQWNGQHWTYLLDEPSTWTFRRVGFHAGDLYLMGSFATLGGVTTQSFARWNGASWEPVGDGPGFSVFCLLSASNGRLLIGGSNSAGARAASWDGERWTDLNIGEVLPGSGVFRLMEHRGELVALGRFPELFPATEPLAVRRVNTGNDAWIAWQPKGMEIVCGGSTTLRARVANGYVVASATWFRNGVPVDADRVAGVRVELDGGHAVLRLDDVSSDVAGTYRCVFETACGVVESEPAVVAVTGVCCPGDLTLDGVVDDADFLSFAQAYFTMTCESAKMRPGCAADLDGDAVVGDTDFEVFALAYDAFVCPG